MGGPAQIEDVRVALEVFLDARQLLLVALVIAAANLLRVQTSQHPLTRFGSATYANAQREYILGMTAH